MHDMIVAGKALYWGTSEWSAAEIAAALAIAERHHLHKPVTEQPQYNLFHRERVEKEYARLYDDYRPGHDDLEPAGLGPAHRQVRDGIPKDSRARRSRATSGSPSASSIRRRSRGAKLAPIAQELGCTLAQMSLAWCLKNPRVSTVITGASRPSQVIENMKALEVVPKLDARGDGAHRGGRDGLTAGASPRSHRVRFAPNPPDPCSPDAE